MTLSVHGPQKKHGETLMSPPLRRLHSPLREKRRSRPSDFSIPAITIDAPANAGLRCPWPRSQRAGKNRIQYCGHYCLTREIAVDTQCIICGTRPAPVLAAGNSFGSQGVGRDCPRCGQYYFLGTAIDKVPNLLQRGEIDRSVLSSQIRRMYEERRKPVDIFESDLAAYVGPKKPPNPQEQADRLILWIGDNQAGTHSRAMARIERIAAIVGADVDYGKSGETAFSWLLRELGSEWFERGSLPTPPDITFRLTMPGWKHYESLHLRRSRSRTAFMAMDFKNTVLAKVVAECFKPAVAKAGFTLRPINEEQSAGLIDNQIRAAIQSARFILADLSDDNNGAYFEAGLAEGLGLPVIYTCEAKKFADAKTHFDTNHMLTVLWDVDELDRASKVLTATIRWTLPGEAMGEQPP